MKTHLLGAALACAVTLIFLPFAAHAGEPIVRVGIGIEHDPEGTQVAKGVTDAKGAVLFRNLASGGYTLVIDSKSLIAVMDNRANSPSVKESGSSSPRAGANIPAGGHDRDSKAEPRPIIRVTVTTPSGQKYASKTPYSKETALQGMRLGFKIAENESGGPRATGVIVDIVPNVYDY